MGTRAYEAMIILKSVGGEAELAQAVAQVEEPIKRAGGREFVVATWYRPGSVAAGGAAKDFCPPAEPAR